MKIDIRKVVVFVIITILTLGMGNVAWGVDVYPTGDPIKDVPEVNAAVRGGAGPSGTVYPGGGTVTLKATNASGAPMAFNFGELEYNLTFAPNDPLSRYFSDINNHRVRVNKPVDIKGETVNGNMTTIIGGYQPFAIGPAATDIPDGDVTIQGIHFKDSGMTSISVARTKPEYSVNILGNRFTGQLYEYFGGKDKPCWKSSDGWISDGSKIRMLRIVDLVHYEDVTNLYSLEQRVAAWKDAWASLFFNPVYQDAPGPSGPIPLYGIWFPLGIFIGGPSAPGGVQGPVNIINNYFDLEEDSILPTQFTKVWYETSLVLSLGEKSPLTIFQNTIRNGTSRGSVSVLDATDEVTIQNNLIELGILGSYAQAGIPPFNSAGGIGAIYGYQFGDSAGFPANGGDVLISNNTIVSPTESKDTVGMTVLGMTPTGQTPRSWNSASILENRIHISNGRHGIFVGDTGDVLPAGCSGANVVRNTVEGSGLYGLLIGSIEGTSPLYTRGNTFVANKISRFHATSEGTSSPDFTAADVYLESDTIDNVLVGFSGTVIDNGVGNKITGQPRTIKGGVGPEVSDAVQDIQEMVLE